MVESIYFVLTLVFFQPGGAFPHAWYLQIFFFAMPLVGIGILALGLADFGVMLFNRRNRSKEWEMAVAATFNNHIILVGLGHLGFRVTRHLRDLNQDVVVVELNPEEELSASVRALGIPVIDGDGSRDSTLQAAGAQRARALVLCSQNDNVNMQIAVKARSLNPNIQVIMRIFDDDFASALKKQFGFTALSATGMAAPVFAATAAGMDLTQPISIEGQTLSLARLNLSAQSKLANRRVSEIERDYDVSVVLLRHDHASDFHPAGDRQLAARDVLAVLGGPEQINRLAQDNK
jgi:Trk K+ transport system NAD-binding subunit